MVEAGTFGDWCALVDSMDRHSAAKTITIPIKIFHMTFTFINQLKLINVSEFADKKTKQLNEDDTKQHSEH